MRKRKSPKRLSLLTIVLIGGSTVAPTVTAHWKANQHKAQNITHKTHTANHHITPTPPCSKQIWYNVTDIGREAGKTCEIQELSRSRQSRNAAPASNLKYPRKRGKEEK